MTRLRRILAAVRRRREDRRITREYARQRIIEDY